MQQEPMTNQLPKAAYITPAELTDTLANHERVVVDITSQGSCPWCDMLDAVMRKFMWQFPNLHVVKIDADLANELPDSVRAKMRGVPHLVAFHKGEITETGGFDTEYMAMARWFARAAGTRNPYSRAQFEKDFAAKADAACATSVAAMKQGHPCLEINKTREAAWQEHRRSLEAKQQSGDISEDELKRQIEADWAAEWAIRKPLIQPFYDMRKAAVDAYVETVGDAFDTFLASAKSAKPRSAAGRTTAPVTGSGASTVCEGGVCTLRGRGSKR